MQINAALGGPTTSFLPEVDDRRQAPPFDAWQTTKGLCVATALLLVFLFTDWPREVAALMGASVLLLVGSIANLIGVNLAQRIGIRIDYRVHARLGVPVTLLTLSVTWVWRVWW